MFLAFLLATAPADTPRTYMERVFASYRDPNFSPFDHPEHYFAPRLAAAMKEDSRLAHGEVGYLDGDPICQCQDAEGMKARIERVTTQSADRAKVRVIIDWVDSTARRVTFALVRLKAGWRIADVSASDEPSLLQALEQANRKARAKHRR
jgi:hypothetical protein